MDNVSFLPKTTPNNNLFVEASLLRLTAKCLGHRDLLTSYRILFYTEFGVSVDLEIFSPRGYSSLLMRSPPGYWIYPDLHFKLAASIQPTSIKLMYHRDLDWLAQRSRVHTLPRRLDFTGRSMFTLSLELDLVGSRSGIRSAHKLPRQQDLPREIGSHYTGVTQNFDCRPVRFPHTKTTHKGYSHTTQARSVREEYPCTLSRTRVVRTTYIFPHNQDMS